jgi:hypothetical protein
LLVRIAEVETGIRWPKIMSEMQRLHFGELFGNDGRILQLTELITNQLKILNKHKINPDKPVLKVNMTA